MEVVAALTNVSKTFGTTVALKSLSLTVKKGQAIALLGPNGAGKSTALSILLGLRQPTSGNAKLFGAAPGSPSAMQKIGVTPQMANFPPQLTPVELLQFACSHFPAPHKIDYLINTFGLEEIAKRRVQGFSGGERRKIAIAMCFAGNPELVILDEPTSGLDTEGQKKFQTLATDYIRQGASLILTSHYWPEIENVADHIIMIDKGKTVLSGAIAEIKAAVNVNRISFNASTANRFVQKNFTKNNSGWTMTTTGSDEIIRQLVESGQDFTNLKITPRSLEEAIAIYRDEKE